jgi:casein kinase II subunit alpha
LKQGLIFLIFRLYFIFSSPTPYEIIKKIGRGKYGEVYKGVNIETAELVAIKILKPISKKKIKKEVEILQELGCGPNIVRLIDVCHDPI